LLGLAEVTMPNFEALSETLKGAGLMGELDIPAVGQFSAMTFTMNFRSLLDDPMKYAVSKAYHFDLRSAQSHEDNSTYERGEAKERYSIVGPIKKIDHGKRSPHAFWDASMDVAVRRVEHYMDGKLYLEFDPLNSVYKINGVDIYAQVRAAIS